VRSGGAQHGRGAPGLRAIRSSKTVRVAGG
jgi:hypothetical protein